MTNICFVRWLRESITGCKAPGIPEGSTLLATTDMTPANFPHEPEAIIEDIYGDYSPLGPPYYKQPLSDKTFAVCKHCGLVYSIEED